MNGNSEKCDSDSQEKLNVLVCRELGDDNVEVWSDREKAFKQVKRNSNGLSHMSVGKFYTIETMPDGTLQLKSIPEIFHVNIRKTGVGKHIVIAQVPIFIGNQLQDSRKFICYSEFFGRVYYDASYTATKIEQFKTYMCLIKSMQSAFCECQWEIHQLLYVHRPSLRYYLLEVHIENIGSNGDIYCERNNLKLFLRREDLREHCYEDLIPLLVIYVVAFKNQPYLPQCHLYRSCFATLIDDFTSELSKNALVPAEISKRCCDENTKRRAMVLAKLMHDEEFIQEFLDLDPQLKERLFKFMLTGGTRQPTFNNENLLL